MTTQINTEDLKVFLKEAHRQGYGAANKNLWIKEADGSTSIRCQRGLWSYHDNFFGGEPYGGREVIFYQDRAIWMMSYYGQVYKSVDPDDVYLCLRQALLLGGDSLPVRGPGSFSESGSGLVYRCYWVGNIESFIGHEAISHSGSIDQLYEAHFQGGWVDQRRGD